MRQREQWARSIDLNPLDSFRGDRLLLSGLRFVVWECCLNDRRISAPLFMVIRRILQQGRGFQYDVKGIPMTRCVTVS
jgi:hypothetical protein